MPFSLFTVEVLRDGLALAFLAGVIALGSIALGA